MPAGYVEEPGCIPAGKCITDIQHSSVAAGAAKCSAMAECASFSYLLSAKFVLISERTCQNISARKLWPYITR